MLKTQAICHTICIHIKSPRGHAWKRPYIYVICKDFLLYVMKGKKMLEISLIMFEQF